MVRDLSQQSLHDGLPDPPHGVGDEPVAALLVEAVSGLEQPQVALIDEVGQHKALVYIALGNGHDEAQVGPDQGLQGFLVTRVNARRQLDLFFTREELVAIDVTEIDLESFLVHRW